MSFQVSDSGKRLINKVSGSTLFIKCRYERVVRRKSVCGQRAIWADCCVDADNTRKLYGEII